ncbi:MAG: hypothetical protein V3U76_01690 [Granulosicoccus sp.]
MRFISIVSFLFCGFCANAIAAGQPLNNGGVVHADLTIGDLDSYTFYAEQGDTLTLSMGETSSALEPQLSVYTPDGALWLTDWDYNTAILLNQSAPATGTYSVQANTRNGDDIGTYDLFFNRMPGANEGGTLSDNDMVSAELTAGDLDSYTFYAEQGDTLTLSMGETSSALEPQLSVYTPDGALWLTDWDYNTAILLNQSAPATGTYSVQANTRNGDDIGTYDLSFNCAGVCAGSPPAASLVSPIGNIVNVQPAFEWEPAPGATWYYLWVNGPNGNIHKAWYTAASAGCSNGSGICSVTLTSLLVSGAHSWWIRTWNSDGIGPWSVARRFTVNSAGGPPAAATLISPNGTIATTNPTYTWSAVPGSTWYYLWVNDANGAAIRTWKTAAQAGCTNGNGTCSITSATNQNGNSVWWIRTWNANGIGPWSNGMSFVAPF